MADMLLFSGLAYTVCYFILGLFFGYYYIPGFIIGFYAVASYVSHYINLKNTQRINWNPSTRLITVFALLVLQLLLFVRPTQYNLWNAGNYQIRRKNYSMSSKQLYSLIQKGWSIYMLFYDEWGWASAQGLANWYGEVILNRGIWFYNKNPTSNEFENKSYIQNFGAPLPESLRFPEKSLILSNRNDRIKSLEIRLTANPKGTPDIYYLGKYNFNMLGGADFMYSIGEIPEDFVQKIWLKAYQTALAREYRADDRTENRGRIMDKQTTLRKPMISIISPFYNEGGKNAAGIAQYFGTMLDLLQNIRLDGQSIDFEILCIDDGSADDTLVLISERAQLDKRIKVLGLSRNFGKEAALSAGLDFCSGDAAIPFDADLQHPPEIVPQMLELWHESRKTGLAFPYYLANTQTEKSRFGPKAQHCGIILPFDAVSFRFATPQAGCRLSPARPQGR